MKIKFETIIQLFFITAVLGVSISYSKLYLFHIILSILIISFVYIKINRFKFTITVLPTKLHYIFYIMLIWYGFSIIWSINSSYSFIYLFYIICGLSIVIILIYYLKDLATQEKLFNILSIIFIVEIVLSLFEAFTDFRLPISPFSSYITYFGRDIKFDESLDSSIVSIILQSPTGFQWNPNNLSVTMLIVLPFFLLYKKKYIKYTGVISIFLLIVMSGSRGVFIAFSFMIFLYLFFLNKKRFLLSISILPLIVILLISNLDTLKNSENNKINEIATSFDVLIIYLEGNNDGSNSIGIRQQLIKNGLDALIVSNFLGVGGGGSVAVQEKYGDIRGHATTSMHNFWIEMLVDSGVLFTIFFLLWYTYIVLKLYLIGIRTKHLKFKYYSQALFLSMSSFTLGAISASTVIYLLPMWIMFSFAIATINNYKRYKNETITTLKP